MAQTLTNMGLSSWDLAGDVFNRTQLHNNWVAIDTHDHTTGKGVQIPSAGIASGAITGAKIAAGAVAGSNIAAASISDAALASPVNPSYKPVCFASGPWDGTVGTFGFSQFSTLYPFTALNMPGLIVVPWVAADWAVAGLQTKVRMRVSWWRNAVAASAATTIITALRPVSTSSGTSGNIVYGFGSAVLPSIYLIQSPVASTVGTATTPDFTLADGNYLFSLSSPGLSPAGSYGIGISMTLQVHHTP